MLVLFGILGLLQILLLPGLIIIRAAKLRGGLAEHLLRVVPLSMIYNYLLVFLLTALHLYRRPVMIAVIVLELAGILWLYRKSLFRRTDKTAAALSHALLRELRPLADFLTDLSGNRAGDWIWAASGCAALSGVLWGLHLCRLNYGTVFSGWDTLFSWNAYAEIWASGRVPEIGGMYPQLVASNWSISYLLQGSSAVQLFNTLIPPLFFLMIMLMLFDLGFQRRECGFFFAAVIARYMMKKLLGDHLFDGYMDVPAAAMCLLSIYTFMKAENRPDEERCQGIFLGTLFAAGAAVTKQSGFIALIAAPAAILILHKDAAASLSRRQKAALIGMALLIVLPWYAHCLLFRTNGAERELIANGIRDYNLNYNLQHRVRLAADTLGKYGICFLLSLAGLPFVPKRYRFLFSLMVWPLTVLWAVSYSYDARNLGPVLPFAALLCGLALAGMGSAAVRLFGRLGFGKIPLLVVCAAAAAAALFLLIRLYPDDRLTEDQRALQKALFGERLNRELLYDVLGETHEGHDVYTDYPAQFLSGYSECCAAAELTNENQVRSVLESDTVNWLLLPLVMPNDSDPSKALIEQCIADGKCELQRCSDGYYKTYCLYEVKH